MASMVCLNTYRFPSEILCGAIDGTFQHARRPMQVSVVSGITGKAISSCKVSSMSSLSRKAPGVAEGNGDARRKALQWRLRWSPRPRNLRSYVTSKAGLAARVGADIHTLVSRTQLLRPDLLELQSDESTYGQQYSGATFCNVNFWLRSFCSTLLAIGLSCSLTLGAEARSDCNDVAAFYAPVHGLEGQELKKKLHDIIKDHDVLSYIQVWDALKVLDEAGDDPNTVAEIYSLKKVAKSLQASADGWNREHLWPRSYGLTMGRPEFTDLQNLRPSDVNVNSSRGNKFFGECTESMSSKCMVPANKEAASDTGSNKDVWMPPAQVRGDIARALMYMAVRYGVDQPAGSPDLQLSDSPSVENAQMGRLSDLLRWNEIDPPSAVEKLRNNRICSLYQHNRNPFVDHPGYAKSIWGVAITSRAQVPLTAQSPIEKRKDAWIHESHYDNVGVDQDEFVEVVVGPKVNPLLLTLVFYNGGDGKLYRTLPLRDGTIFSRVEDVGMGFTFFVANLPSGSLQNGPRDSLALVEENSSSLSPAFFVI
ncbi:unnamed protein product [Calypogeia fissa]